MSGFVKKKIIFITQALWVGGIETALANMLNNFDYDTYDVTCLVLQNDIETAQRITPKCRILVVDRNDTVSFSEKYKYSRMFGLIQKPYNASAARKLVWKILSLSFRAFENRLYASYIRRLLNDESFDTAVIYTNRISELAVRSINADKFITFFHHGLFHREYHDVYGYKKAEKIVLVSDSIKKQFTNNLPRFSDKLTVIHNITDVKSIREKSLCETVSFSAGFNIVSCGRLHRDKGFDMAIEACKMLLDDGHTDLHWYVVGEGPERENLLKAANEHGASENFHFLGVKPNPYPYMKAADIFVQSSRIEAFGLTITEALSLGVPVISTATHGGKEIITDKVNGLLCEVSADSIYRSIKNLIENPDLRKRIAAGAGEIDFEAQNAEILNKLYSLL